MNYEKIYDDLIERCKNRKLSSDTYQEKHHIIPKCLNGSDDNDNLVYLTAREHYIAHLSPTKDGYAFINKYSPDSKIVDDNGDEIIKKV